MPRAADQRDHAIKAIRKAVDQSDHWGQGSFLPSERLLAQKFGVSRS
ncbi:MAG: GntR family transcriptional regulator, partial [Planctomycetes bacterium]|nr:GntR family transcriptional regulator [Planctomycetota bacterium]